MNLNVKKYEKELILKQHYLNCVMIRLRHP
jgi:hypothetical protein